MTQVKLKQLVLAGEFIGHWWWIFCIYSDIPEMIGVYYAYTDHFDAISYNQSVFDWYHLYVNYLTVI